MHQASFAERDKHLWPAVGLGAAHVFDRAAGADCRRLGPHPSSSPSLRKVAAIFFFFFKWALFFSFFNAIFLFFFNFRPLPVKNILNYQTMYEAS